MATESTKVAVIMGGTSFERKFSLRSGKLVCDLLTRDGYELLPLDADEHLVDTLRSERPDAAFVCLHGAGGEDGAVPALLEFLRIPYVGSRAAVCRAAWNKPDTPFVMRRTFSAEESDAIWPAEVALPMGAFKDLGAAAALDLVAGRIGSGFPLAVKPAHGGSAMGVTKVDEESQLGEAIMTALAYDDVVMIEEWIEGAELSCTVLELDDGPQVLPEVEIHAHEGLYDTDARTNPERVDYFCPARDQSLASGGMDAADAREAARRAALDVFEAFDCRDLARVDLIWDGSKARIMDLKTFPGLTETSLVPMAVEAAGLDMASTLDALVRKAIVRGC
jgi:D-alanine-D-alanine ligase